MNIIQKIRLSNFKRFDKVEIYFNEDINILIGDNEAGKSSILSALDIVMSGSLSKVETLGLENLFNTKIIHDFLAGNKSFDKLPILFIEIFLTEQNNPDLNGKDYPSAGESCDGLKLVCEPRDELSKEINEILQQDQSNFPFEYYSIRFTTFSGMAYTGYRRFIKHLLLDNSQINNEYATKEYIKAIYHSHVDDTDINKHQNEYRKHKIAFRDTALKDLNEGIEDYQFSIRTSSKSNLVTDLTLTEEDITIENKGKGRQCFIKTDFALRKNDKEKDIDVLLLEEPENHLSHVNMKKLIQRINSSDKQLFISTHNNLICSRLDLQNAILLNSNSSTTVSLIELSDDTAKFFMKAPDNNLLEMILSKKIMLVEGDAEYILMEALYRNLTGESFENSDIHIISVGGTSFKRYLELARLLNIKTAVIRDNDGDFQKTCVDRYAGFINENIRIFYDTDDDRRTFEVSFYQDNQAICDELFGPDRRTLSPQQYMLDNKADVAFQLLDNKANNLIPPDYMREAIEWIRQ